MKKSVYLILGGIILLLNPACEKKSDDDQNTRMKEIALTPVQKSLVQAGNTFALNLFGTTCREEENKPQVFISPYSVSEALTMTYNGAAGATADSMAQVLGYGNMSREEINAYCKTLRTTLLKLDPKVQLSIANSIWYRLGFDVQTSFIDVNKTWFDAAVQGLNFSSPQAPATINKWIADKTNNRIKDVIQEIDPATVMFLVNAIWFKGMWTNSFDPKNTMVKDFNCPGGKTVTASFMQQEHTFPYYRNDVFAMAEMPYGQGNYAMLVLLPNEGKTIIDVLNCLNSENWAEWKTGLQEKKLRIEFPKLKFTYKIILNQVLSKMGMGIAFTDDADFSGINPIEDLLISKVLHHSFLEVNEEGTEAAAVTVVDVAVTSAPVEPEIIPFVVNKPFLFAIHERSTGAILFVGMINEPEN